MPRSFIHNVFSTNCISEYDESKKAKGIELKMREKKEILNDVNFRVLPWIFSNKKPHNKMMKPPMIGNHRAKERIGELTISRS